MAGTNWVRLLVEGAARRLGCWHCCVRISCRALPVAFTGPSARRSQSFQNACIYPLCILLPQNQVQLPLEGIPSSIVYNGATKTRMLMSQARSLRT